MSNPLNNKEKYDLNNMNVAAQNIQLGTYLDNLTTSSAYHYSGVREKPSISLAGDGSVTIGRGIYALYPDSSGSSAIQVFELNGGTFILDDKNTSYIYAKYNSGSPIVTITTDRHDVVSTSLTNAIPIFTLYRFGDIVNILDWDELGLATGEKLILRCVDTDRFHRVSGLILGEYGTRNVSITSGSVWYGASRDNMETFVSTGSPITNLYLFGRENGIWSGSLVTQYDNFYYQNTNGLSELTSNKYGVNWVYRLINSGSISYAGIILGTDDYSYSNAIESQLPSSVPEILTTQGLLVGKIIVKKGENTATLIQSAFGLGFITATTSLDHNALFNLQGGATGQYYHLTEDNYNKISGSSYSGIFGDSENYTAFEADGTLIMSGSATVWDDLFFPLTAGKQGALDKPAFSTTEIAYLFPQDNSSEVIYITAQFPHCWKTGTDISPHVHWKQTNSGSVVFKMDYKWFDIGTSVPSNFQTYVMDVDVMPYTSGSIHQLTGGSSTISGSHINGVSSLMLIKLYRDDNSYTGNAVTYQFDMHIEIDSLGSRELYIK